MVLDGRPVFRGFHQRPVWHLFLLGAIGMALIAAVGTEVGVSQGVQWWGSLGVGGAVAIAAIHYSRQDSKAAWKRLNELHEDARIREESLRSALVEHANASARLEGTMQELLRGLRG